MSELFPASPIVLGFGFLLTVLAAAVQGTIGLGFAMMTVPLLSLLDPDLAPVPQLLLTFPLTVFIAWRERSAIELRATVWALLGRIPGSALGVLLLKLASARVLDVLIGAMVITAVAALSTRLELKRTPMSEFLAGVASGVGALVSSIAGPPMALLYRNERGPTIRANLSCIFAVGLVITIAARALAGEVHMSDLSLAAIYLPALALGLLLSRALIERVEGRPLRVAILWVASLAGTGLLVRGALGLIG